MSCPDRSLLLLVQEGENLLTQVTWDDCTTWHAWHLASTLATQPTTGQHPRIVLTCSIWGPAASLVWQDCHRRCKCAHRRRTQA